MSTEKKEIPLDLKLILDDITKLNDSIGADHAKIDERLFVRDFLPLLTATTDVDLRPWIAIAGHANRAVDVVRRQGNTEVVLYTVPPLLNHKGGTAVDYNPHLSVFQIVTEAARKARNFPGQEAEIFNRAMEAAEIGTITQDDRAFIQWNAVLVANGLEPIKIAALEKQLQEKATDEEDTGFDGYDEL